MLVYRGKLGLEDDAVAGKVFKAKEPFIIDDWERDEVLWMAEDNRSTPSLSNDSQEGSKSMAILVSSGEPPETKIYDSPSNSVFGLNMGWAYDSDFKFIWMNEPGQRIPKGVCSKITRLTLYAYAPTYHRDETNYYVNLQPILYIYDGTIPGKFVAAGDVTQINGNQLPLSSEPGFAPITCTFANGGVKLDQKLEYNISVKALNFILYPGAYFPAVITPAIRYANAGFFDQEFGNYELLSSYGLYGTIYGTANLNLAYREIKKDCSKYDSLQVTAKSDLSGNVVDFVYGMDKDHTVSAPLTLGTTFQKISVSISSNIDKSNLGYFAFKLGQDGIDSDGKSKENTIYIDQIEAE